MVSVLILTLNEEANLPRCLDSVSRSDDIVVFDSYSTDKTVEIAETAGARIVQRKFDNWSSHQNWAMSNIEFKYSWVYYSDADEVVTPQLRDEMSSIAKRPEGDTVAYYVRYKNFFKGRWIRHCGIYPVWVLRFFQPDKVRWERLVNPDPVVNGPKGHLKAHFEHYSFNKGLDDWRRRHIRYAAFEAAETLKSLRSGRIDWAGVLSLGDPVRRRRALKGLSFRLPFRPLLRFFYMYFLRLGFLDGWPGLRYCRLLAWYESMIVQKIKELRRQARALTK